MKEKMLSYVGKSKKYWVDLPRKNKILYISLVVALIAVIVFTLILVNRKEYVSLFDNLTQSENAEVLKRLQEMNADFKLDDTEIQVLKSEEPEIRMQLNIEGYPKSGTNTYDFFTNNVSIMSTDFEKKNVLIFQLQERMSSTIKIIDGVKDAVVTIAMPDNKGYVFQEDKIDTTASVMLSLDNGMTLDSAKVEGIRNLLATSVTGLAPENVTITDSIGNELGNSGATTLDELTQIKLQTERSISQEAKEKVLGLLEPAYGDGKVSVAITSTLDYDDLVKEIETYYPYADGENTGVIKEGQTIIEQGVSGTNSGGIPGTESNSEIIDYEQVTQGNGEYNRNEAYNVYLVNGIKEYVKKNTPKISAMTIAVMIDSSELPTDENERLNELIKSATSATEVSIFSREFAPIIGSQSSFEIFLKEGNNFIIFSLLLFAFILTVLILSMIIFVNHRKRKLLFETAAAEEAIHYNLGEYFGENGQPLDMPIEAIQVSDSKDQQLKKQISDFANSNPEIVGQLLRTWLKGDADNYD